jgi:hypothetical protein
LSFLLREAMADILRLHDAKEKARPVKNTERAFE